jgi:hypothetical protein
MPNWPMVATATVAGGQFAGAAAGAGAADHAQKFLDVPPIHAGAVVAETQRAVARFVHVDADFAGRFRAWTRRN